MNNNSSINQNIYYKNKKTFDQIELTINNNNYLKESSKIYNKNEYDNINSYNKNISTTHINLNKDDRFK